MLPTFCEMAGLEVPENVDGISMLPTFLGQEQPEHDYLYWEFSPRGGWQAIRQGNFKAVRGNLRKNADAKIELYDLSRDLAEKNNVAADYPAKVQQMKALFSKARIDSPNFPLFQNQ